ncbi:MAG: Ig-like domain-containing protein [Microbacterium sp.]
MTIGTLAFVYEGNPTTEVDLNDGGVWVTKQSSLLVGHLNHSSGVLDGGLRTATERYDVLQSGAQVLVVDPVANKATPVDPARVALEQTTDLPAGAAVSMGGGVVAVTEPSGELWAAEFGSLGAIGGQGNEPIAELGDDAVAAVGVDGDIYALEREQPRILTYARGDDGTFSQVGDRVLSSVDPAADVEMTVVGRTGYAFDTDARTLYGTDGSVLDVPVDAVLQQPSEPTDAVTVATPTALVRVSADAEPVVVDAGGEGIPTRPVYVAGCAYGAWAESARFVRDCPGETDDLVLDIEGLAPTGVLTFRVNRDVVVLNDVFGGAAWLASDAMQRVDNWDDLTPPEGEGDEEEETTEETVQAALPERTDQNTAPLAEDDEYGVRPGRTTILPILENDTDADGDVLVAVPLDEPSFGELEPVHNGKALQIVVPEDATGTTTFRYRAEDGRGGTAEARVRVAVHDWDVNAPPEQKRVTPVTVEAGGTAAYNVLPDWIDPDGDDIFLQSVAVDGGDEADFTSDGHISFRAIGGTQGRIDVPIVVSDGTDSGVGVARYEVRPLGAAVPVTNADHVVTRVGRSVTVSPLANDASTGTEPLRLTRVDEVDGARVVPDYADKTFSFVADAVGTYYVNYLVSAGANSVPGVVRVDVLARAEGDPSPIAVRDVALLPAGDDVLVNVLSNDTDPAGGILVVQSVVAEPGSGVAASVLGHETIRITDLGALTAQVRVTYTISNGSKSATGEIVVIPVPAPERLRPPIANDDRAVVRAGDVVTIAVLDNDYHPNGDPLHLAPGLVPPLVDDEDGEVFVAENVLRFRAGDRPGTVYATYEAVDSSGQRDAGYVTIQVLPRDDESNAAPRPRDLTARTLSGSSVEVPVPLDGIDEDGDSVELVGLASAPSKGRVDVVDGDTFTYTAFDGSTGVDTFTYRVRDRLGKEATATVQVGIAPAESVNQAPYAVRDAIVMRPGREVAVPVLANDSDPDGEPFGFAVDAVDVPDVPGLAARVTENQLYITAPREPMRTSVQYTIVDARGLTATTSVQITVDADVPLVPPIANDDRVRPEDVTDDGMADIEVLLNDRDPDGTRDALTVDIGAGGENARILSDSTMRIVLTEDSQLITYRITDADDQTATAFVHVPALQAMPPSLIAGAAIEVLSGETVEVPLAAYVQAVGGRGVVLTEAAKVAASHGDGASLVRDQRTLVYTSNDQYSGQDALTFEVTDGDGPDDPNGRKATLTIPITVLPPENVPPEMVGASMTVAAGEEASTLDLADLATDADPGDQLTFALGGAVPAGLDAVVDGSLLRVSASTDAEAGTRATVTVTVTDGESEPVRASIAVTVVSSTRPLASANDDVIAEARQGETLDVPVLDNDVNPFPDTPLRIVSTAVETGTAQARINGDRVQVTPGGSFVGTIVVRYRVLDATGDDNRGVEARVRITVQSGPEVPGRPTVSSVQSRTVVLSWTAPIDNGAPITGYTVSSTSGGYTKQCASTTCTLDGLTNNTEYNFIVTATNRNGTSDPSLPSETARPDVRPQTPAPPTITAGDSNLAVSWTRPPTEGSPVASYTLEISPAPATGSVQKVNVTGTSLVWEGLTNGTAYQVRVRAHNQAPEPSGWSAWSATDIPAAPPSAPAAPTTQRLDAVGSQNQLRVSWNQPASNGDAISGYQLDVMQGGATIRTVSVPAGQTSQAVTVDNSTTSYTFRVRAQNKAGWGGRSAASAPLQSFGRPGAPTGVQAGPGDNMVVVMWTPGAGNGATAAQISYEFSINGGAWRSDWMFDGDNGAGSIGNGLADNNGTYSVRIRAVATVGGVSEQSEPSAPTNQVAPYGPIGSPTAGWTSSGTTITFSWESPPRNGRDITTRVRIDTGAWQTVSPSGSTTIDVGYGASRTFRVETSAAGQTTSATVIASTGSPPQARARVSHGSHVQCGAVDCDQFLVTTSNFPDGTYPYRCYANGSSIGSGVGYFRANGQQELSGCYYGSASDATVWVRINGTNYETSSW